MALANRYGINYGEIMQTSNAIKNARLLREKTKRGFEKEDAIAEGTAEAMSGDSEELGSDALATSSKVSKVPANEYTTGTNAMNVGVTDENSTDSEELIDGSEKPSRADNFKKISKTNEVRKIQEANRLKIERERKRNGLIKYHVSKGSSKEEATTLVDMGIEEQKKIDESYRTSSDAQQESMKQGMAKSGKWVQGLLEVGGKNPAQADKMWKSKLVDLDNQILDAYKKGNKQLGAELESQRNKQKNSILKEDGTVDFSYLNLKLGEINSQLTSEDYYTKEQRETKKHIRKAPKVITHGDKDIKLTPTKDGWKEEKTTSNSLIKAKETAKGKGGGIKTADYDKVRKRLVANLTGMDIDEDDFSMEELSQTKRDMIAEANMIAEKIYRDNFDKGITPQEAVNKAKKTKEYKLWKAKYYPKEGATRSSKKSGKEIYKDGEWIKF